MFAALLHHVVELNKCGHAHIEQLGSTGINSGIIYCTSSTTMYIPIWRLVLSGLEYVLKRGLVVLFGMSTMPSM